MLFTYLLTLVSFAAAAATPYKNTLSTCKNPVKRVEWRQLKDADKQSYISAVTCLKTKPSRLGLKTSLFDDFAYVHFQYNPSSKQWTNALGIYFPQYWLKLIVHLVAAFLPWHRYFTHVYEGALRECGYTGYATYWDWTKDVKKLAKSPVMSSKLGFGGDGSDTNKENIFGDLRCVIDGPFSKLRPSYYGVSARVREYKPHCLHRHLADGETTDSINFARQYNKTNVAIVQKNAKFLSYHDALEQGPHQAIHSAIGGEMNPATSPNGKSDRTFRKRVTHWHASQTLSSSFTIHKSTVSGGNGRKPTQRLDLETILVWRGDLMARLVKPPWLTCFWWINLRRTLPSAIQCPLQVVPFVIHIRSFSGNDDKF